MGRANAEMHTRKSQQARGTKEIGNLAAWNPFTINSPK
jgi:hypothetical protein